MNKVGVAMTTQIFGLGPVWAPYKTSNKQYLPGNYSVNQPSRLGHITCCSAHSRFSGLILLRLSVVNEVFPVAEGGKI